MRVIGITGTLGAGKGTVVERLVEKGFKHFSAREFIVEEVKRRGLTVSRDTTTPVANELAARHGAFYIARALYEQARKSGYDAVIESIRRPAEAEYLKKKGDFILVAVDADERIRYERISKRASETDNVTFKKFAEEELREMSSEDPTKQNIRACISMADFLLTNNGTREELQEKVDKVLAQISA